MRRGLRPRIIARASRICCASRARSGTKFKACNSWLHRSVELYCLALGQPRQDDLLARDQVQGGMSSAELAQLQISLRPG
jgi:hypothetical protein